MILNAIDFIKSALPAWFWSLLFSAGAFLLIVIVCILLLLVVSRALRVKQMKEQRLQITNQGNVRSVYRIKLKAGGMSAAVRPDHGDERLNFKLLMNRVPLAEVIEEIPEMEAVSVPAAVRTNVPAAASGAAVPGPRQAAGGVKQVEKQVSEKSGKAASFLAALGNLLPGAAGQQLKEQGAAVRGVQTKANQAMVAQDSAARKVEAVKKGSSSMGIKPGVPAQPAPAAGARTAEPATGPGSEVVPGPAGPVSGRKNGRAFQAGASAFETCEVEPGQTIELMLQIRPKQKLRAEASYLYTISSQQVPVQKIEGQAEPVLRQGLVYFPAVPGWRFWLPAFLQVVIVAGALLGLAVCLVLIWS